MSYPLSFAKDDNAAEPEVPKITVCVILTFSTVVLNTIAIHNTNIVKPCEIHCF